MKLLLKVIEYTLKFKEYSKFEIQTLNNDYSKFEFQMFAIGKLPNKFFEKMLFEKIEFHHLQIAISQSVFIIS